MGRNDFFSVVLKTYPDILNVDEMCGVLGISKKTGYKLLQAGEIVCIKVGRTYRIPKVNLLTYLKVGYCK